jgi:penicillin G amidase
VIGVATTAAVVLGAFGLAGCMLSPPKMNSIPTETRLATFPTTGLPLKEPASVRWTPEQVPFIEAGNDEDAALLLGMVHAHLRLAQMEILRRLSQGRLSESAGPFTVEIDQALRTIDFGKAVPQIKAMLKPGTRRWIERYVEGINLYCERSPKRPPEARLLGLEAEKWTVEDVIRAGRLTSIDINWVFLGSMIRMKADPKFAEYWERTMGSGKTALPSFGAGSAGEAPGDPLNLLAGISRSGSNCVVVSGGRSASGSALMASDPHVGVFLPPLWTIVGYATPGNRVLGFSIAGLPAVVVGRNEHIAWGGTNMIGLSSSFYDVTSMKSSFTTRKEKIGVRFWMDREVEVTDSPMGPVLSRVPLLGMGEGGKEIAITWRGHTASDEFSAFLDVSRATNWDEFRAAFEPYAVSGQNFQYADRAGNIGQLLALEYDPASGRTAMAIVGDPANPEHRWGNPIKSTQLPAAYNPPAGFLISCNNTPVRTEPPITLFTNANDRYSRFVELLSGDAKLGTADMKRIQQDVTSPLSIQGRDALVRAIERIGAAKPTVPAQALLLEKLREWDGSYRVDSLGATAYQLLLFHTAQPGWHARFGKAIGDRFLGATTIQEYYREDLDAKMFDALIPGAIASAAKDFTRSPFKDGTPWGELHRMSLAHPAGRAPLIGGWFRFGDDPAPGGTSTIFKSVSKPTNKKHSTEFGANARCVFDLSGPDENSFSMLGGQDGWLGSTNFLDLYQLWRKGEYVRLPLTRAGVEKTFSREMNLSPR